MAFGSHFSRAKYYQYSQCSRPQLQKWPPLSHTECGNFTWWSRRIWHIPFAPWVTQRLTEAALWWACWQAHLRKEHKHFDRVVLSTFSERRWCHITICSDDRYDSVTGSFYHLSITLTLNVIQLECWIFLWRWSGRNNLYGLSEGLDLPGSHIPRPRKSLCGLQQHIAQRFQSCWRRFVSSHWTLSRLRLYFAIYSCGRSAYCMQQLICPWYNPMLNLMRRLWSCWLPPWFQTAAQSSQTQAIHLP